MVSGKIRRHVSAGVVECKHTLRFSRKPRPDLWRQGGHIGLCRLGGAAAQRGVADICAHARKQRPEVARPGRTNGWQRTFDFLDRGMHRGHPRSGIVPAAEAASDRRQMADRLLHRHWTNRACQSRRELCRQTIGDVATNPDDDHAMARLRHTMLFGTNDEILRAGVSGKKCRGRQAEKAIAVAGSPEVARHRGEDRLALDG